MSYRRRQTRMPWDETRARHFSSPKIPVPQPPMEMPSFEMPEFPAIEMPAFPEFPTFNPDAGAAKARREEQIAKQRAVEQRRKGYGSTLLTGGRGDESEPPLNRPSLLGR